MPDTYIPGSIDTSLDSIYLLQADTKQRFDNVFSGVQAPLKYSLPNYEPNVKGVNQYLLTDEPTVKGSLNAGLFSEDANQRDLAWNLFNRDFQKDPVHKGVGTVQTFQYDKSLDKYLEGDLGYNPYLSIEENEARNYKYDYMEHSLPSRIFRNIGVGVGRFLTGVAAKTVQTFGYLGSMIWNGIEEVFNADGNNAMADIADNTLSRWAENWEEDWKNSQALAVFKPKGWEDMGFFQKLGQGAFWTDEVADGAAFMGEMILSSYLMGGIGKIGAIGRLGATDINIAGKLSKYGTLATKMGKTLDYTVKAATGAKDVSGIGRWAFMTSSESAFEASGKYHDVKRDLEDKRNKGENNLTDSEIRTKAGDVAASSFRSNLAVLSLSNAFENKFIFEPILGRGGRLASKTPRNKLSEVGAYTDDVETSLAATPKNFNYKTKLGKTIDWKNPNSRARFYGTRAFQAIGAEGYWEENAQLAIERLSANDDFKNSGFFGKKKMFATQLLEQTVNSLTGDDPEAATAIGLGGVIGVLGTGAGAKFSGERKGNKIDNLAKVAEYDARRREFLSFNTIYNEDGTVDEGKAAALFQGIYKTMDKQQAADRARDPKLRKFHQDSALSDYVYAAKKAGLFERVVDKLDEIPAMHPDDVKEMGFNPSVTAYATEISKKTKVFGDAYEDAQNSVVEKKSTKDDDLDDYYRKHQLYKAKTIAHTTSELAEEYLADDLAKKRASIYSAEGQGQASDVQAYNSLVRQEESLNNFERMSKDHPGFFKDHINTERARITKEKERIGTVLDDRINRGELEKFMGIIITPGTYKGTTDEILNQINTDFKAQKMHAELLASSAQHRYLEQRLSNPVTGLKAYREHRDYNDSIQAKDQEIDQNKTDTHTVKKDEDGTYSVLSPRGFVIAKDIATEEDALKIAKDNDDAITDEPRTITVDMQKDLYDLGYTAEDIFEKDMKVEDAEKIIKDKTRKPKPGPTKVDDEDSDFEPVEDIGAKAYLTPLKTVNRETDNTDAAGNVVPDEEKTAYSRLRDELYDQEQSNFIRKELPTVISAGVYKPYIVNDREKWLSRFTVPFTGELEQIIVFRNDAGEELKLPSGKIAAFSFNELAFDKDIPLRASIRDRELDTTGSAEFYEKEKEKALKVRELLKDNKEAAVPIEIISTSQGILETTKEAAPVDERFGEFEFRLTSPEGETVGGVHFSGKKAIAKIGKQAVEVITRRIIDIPEVADNITALLSKTYQNKEEALGVVKYLKRFIYLKKDKSYFLVTPENRIEYYRNNKRMGLADVLNQRLNISRDALKSGYEKLDVSGNVVRIGKEVSKDEYYNLVKSNLVTNRKVTKQREGEGFFLSPVNAYFSFSIKLPSQPETPTFEVKDKRSEIEARRQEELASFENDRNAVDVAFKDFYREIDSLKKNLKPTGGVTQEAIDEKIRNEQNKSPLTFIDEAIKFYGERLNTDQGFAAKAAVESYNSIRDIYLKYNISAMISSNDVVKMINDKYDAELAVLDKPKTLSAEEFKRISEIENVSELESEGRRLKKEGIQLSPEQKEKLSAKLADLRSKKPGSVISSADVSDAPAPLDVFTFKMGGQLYTLDLTKDKDNLTGKVLTDWTEIGKLTNMMKNNPNIVVRMIPKVDPNSGNMSLKALLIGMKGQGFIALDKDFRRITDLTKVDPNQLEDFKKNICK